MADDEAKAPITQLDLAYLRTMLALDRTLLSWVRTSLTLFGFGFTLARFVRDMALKGMLNGISPEVPRCDGLALMALGMITLMGGAYEYVRRVKAIRTDTSKKLWSVSLTVTVALAILATAMILTLLVDFPKAQ
jgi:putative membrane protein